MLQRQEKSLLPTPSVGTSKAAEGLRNLYRVALAVWDSMEAIRTAAGLEEPKSSREASGVAAALKKVIQAASSSGPAAASE